MRPISSYLESGILYPMISFNPIIPESITFNFQMKKLRLKDVK